MPRETYHDGLQDVFLDENEAYRQPYVKPSADDRPEILRSAFHEIVFVALIAMAAASSVFLQRSLVVIAADVADALDTSPAGMAWSTAASGLTTGALLIPFGHLADANIAPRKTLLLLSLAAFALPVALVPLAPSGVVVDVLAGLAGAACAATIPAAVGLLSFVYARASRRRNLAFASFLMGSPAATVLGGLGAGELASARGWKAPFVFLAALYIVVAGLGWVFVPNFPGFPGGSSGSGIEIPMRTSSLGPFLTGFRGRKAYRLVGSGQVRLDGHVSASGGHTPVHGGTHHRPGTVMGYAYCHTPAASWHPFSCVFRSLGEYGQSAHGTPRSLVNLSAMSCSVAFYSAVFWISTYLQKVEGFSPFDVAVRLLPQALTGLFFSPLVGLFMNKVSGTAILVAAALFSVASNVLLIFLRPGSSYFLWIFPSLLLSTIGMDWTMNVGSLYILSSLPLKHHSIGGSLLQTTARLGVPLGLVVTTAVWTSFDEKRGLFHPEVPYLKVFITTTAFAGFTLVLAPLIRIGKQGNSARKEGSEKQHQQQPPSPDKVVWVICERCGSCQKQMIRNIGDPARYFDDDLGMENWQKHNHGGTIVNRFSNCPSLVYHPHRKIGIAA
ncbi:major facilitator superfamily-domain-containing protein [Apiospora kogelbergensis]|uniref:Major facilitator superfamily-domain-containing protein n=1 Tax=Apiospora kogelbergensis TaxID=1337665 RepID=A0AAW0QXM4_9PEZI